MKHNEWEFDIDKYLKLLRIETLCDWDVLAFLYRHQASLVGPDHIARLVGYDTGKVVHALQSLESSGLVARSRVFHGVRLYQFVSPSPADPEPEKIFDHFMDRADSREGRLYLIKKLCPDQAKERKSDALVSKSLKGGKRWQKAS